MMYFIDPKLVLEQQQVSDPQHTSQNYTVRTAREEIFEKEELLLPPHDETPVPTCEVTFIIS